MLSQNMPLGHGDCFELKAIKTQQTQEKPFASALAAYKKVDRGLLPLQELELPPEIIFYLKDLPIYHGKHLINKHL